MKSISAADAKNGFGHLIDIARQEPIRIEKHGRAVAVMLSIEEFERLNSLDLLTKKSNTERKEK